MCEALAKTTSEEAQTPWVNNGAGKHQRDKKKTSTRRQAAGPWAGAAREAAPAREAARRCSEPHAGLGGGGARPTHGPTWGPPSRRAIVNPLRIRSRVSALSEPHPLGHGVGLPIPIAQTRKRTMWLQKAAHTSTPAASPPNPGCLASEPGFFLGYPGLGALGHLRRTVSVLPGDQS